MPSEASDMEIRSVENKASLYEQLRTQLLKDIERYRSEGREELADIILKSINTDN